MYIETNSLNPYLVVAEEARVQTYEEILSLIDYRDFAVETFNAEQFLEHHQKQSTYWSNEDFYRKMKFERNEYNIHESKEFSLLPIKVDYKDCKTMCALNQASIPADRREVKDVFKIFSLNGEYMWIETDQTAKQKRKWTYKAKYEYELFFDGKRSILL